MSPKTYARFRQKSCAHISQLKFYKYPTWVHCFPHHCTFLLGQEESSQPSTRKNSQRWHLSKMTVFGMRNFRYRYTGKTFPIYISLYRLFDLSLSSMSKNFSKYRKCWFNTGLDSIPIFPVYRYTVHLCGYAFQCLHCDKFSVLNPLT